MAMTDGRHLPQVSMATVTGSAGQPIHSTAINTITLCMYLDVKLSFLCVNTSNSFSV